MGFHESHGSVARPGCMEGNSLQNKNPGKKKLYVEVEGKSWK